MNFAWHQLLWLLFLPACLLAWEVLRRQRGGAPARPNILRADAGLRSIRLSGPAPSPGDPSGRNRPRLWLACGLFLGILALARPQWGRIDEPVLDQSREIVIALDLSRSMLTPDVKPTRLERAKLLVSSLLDRLAGERVGLVTFSGTSFLQSPLSADYEILREFLPSLGPDYLPEAGTDYGALLDTAARAFTSDGSCDRYLIVLSDGGATDEDWRGRVGKLKDRGIRVIGLGIGTAQGGFIPDGADGYMKDESGAVVKSRLEADTLRELCDKTGGAYRDASEWVDLPGLLKATVEAGAKGRFVEKASVRYIERFQWVLAPAFFCLLMSFWREIPVRPKPRDIRLSGAAAAVLALALASVPGAFAGASEGPPALPPGTLLGRIVGRLSGQDRQSALDWVEMAHQTLTWGRDLQTGGRPVPEGPVRDALQAVDAGERADPKGADWAKIRSDLEDLIRKPEDKPKQQQKQKQDQQQQQQQQQQQGGQKQEQKQDKDQQHEQQQSPSPQDRRQGEPQPQKAFSDMKQPPEPRQGATQQVGGEPDHPPRDPAAADPELAAPLQKLDQVRNQDSPAQLFQMIENNQSRPPEKKGKPW